MHSAHAWVKLCVFILLACGCIVLICCRVLTCEWRQQVVWFGAAAPQAFLTWNTCLHYCQYCAMDKLDIGGPRFCHRATFLLQGCNTFRYIAYITHSRIHETATIVKSHRSIAPGGVREQPSASRIPYFLRKTKMAPVVKHRQNVGKPSFRKLTMEMTVEVTPPDSA